MSDYYFTVETTFNTGRTVERFESLIHACEAFLIPFQRHMTYCAIFRWNKHNDDNTLLATRRRIPLNLSFKPSVIKKHIYASQASEAFPLLSKQSIGI